MADMRQDFSPRQIIRDEQGEWEIAVARHRDAPTFTFDVFTRIGHMKTTEQGTVISCQNMTRADLEEHVARCQAALAKEA